MELRQFLDHCYSDINQKGTLVNLICLFYILAWEPSVARGAHSHSCRLPALTGKLTFPYKSLPVVYRSC